MKSLNEIIANRNPTDDGTGHFEPCLKLCLKEAQTEVIREIYERIEFHNGIAVVRLEDIAAIRKRIELQ